MIGPLRRRATGPVKRRSARLLLWWLPFLATAAAVPVFMGPPHSGHAPAIKSAGKPIDAKVLYAENCASCHGVKAQGTSRAPSLKGVGEAIVDFELSTGRMPKRYVGYKKPPYRAILPEAEVKALDKYVTALAAHGGQSIPKVNPKAGNVSAGGELYRENCAACHGELGIGGELVDRPIPAITEATPTQVAEAVRTGPNQMPKFGTAAIDRKELNSIIAWVEYLKHPADKGGNNLSHVGPVAEGAVAFLIGLVFFIGVARWIGQRG